MGGGKRKYEEVRGPKVIKSKVPGSKSPSIPRTQGPRAQRTKISQSNIHIRA